MRTGVPTGKVGAEAALLELCSVGLAGFGLSFSSGAATVGVEGDGLACWAERLRFNKKSNEAARMHLFMITPDFPKMTVKQG
jgi:hypothetical protein